MEMRDRMNRVELAIENHKKGCNCAQAVALAYVDVLQMDAEKVYHLTEALGGGVGGLRQICGAVSAGSLVLGYQKSNDALYEKKYRLDTYDLIKEYVEKFQEIDGTYQCGELLELRKEKQSNFTTCTDCVRKAAELIEEFLQKG